MVVWCVLCCCSWMVWFMNVGFGKVVKLRCDLIIGMIFLMCWFGWFLFVLRLLLVLVMFGLWCWMVKCVVVFVMCWCILMNVVLWCYWLSWNCLNCCVVLNGKSCLLNVVLKCKVLCVLLFLVMWFMNSCLSCFVVWWLRWCFLRWVRCGW